MNFIPYPRADKSTHPDLVSWIGTKPKREGDWKRLKAFLHECTKVGNAPNSLPKCWFSELPQGDDNALDVEHFRPKNSGNALSPKQLTEIEKAGQFTIQQSMANGDYSWLAFDHRNYRLVTAITNRAGAKHIFFPVAEGTQRLRAGECPWNTDEFPFFLDPTNQQDTELLYVKPNGEITPTTPHTPLTQADYDGLPSTWRNDGFNYARAVVTIELFRLNYTHFVTGRQRVYEETTQSTATLETLFCENSKSTILPDLAKGLRTKILPSEPFSLAAKSALVAYQPASSNTAKGVAIKQLLAKILTHVAGETNKIQIDWNQG